jgi:hypothetical protein
MTNGHHRLAAVAVGMVALVAVPGLACAQGAIEAGHPAHRPLTLAAVAKAQALAAQPAVADAGVAAPRTRDDVVDGALLGAIAGAAALGGFAAIICRLEQEPGAGNCLADTARVAAIGAAIGAGAGLAVDAALSRRSGITLRLRTTF